MTFHSPVNGLPQTERAILTTTAATALLTASQGPSFVHTVYLVEVTGNATTVFLDVTNGTLTYRLTGIRTIGASSDLWLNVEQHLEQGWSLRATAGTANRLHTHVTHALS